ncbi:MAG: hypothetical protein KDA75_14155 [Planctomycetaceae bacterium]|nr:hypothetical protein [Planctomycetaceae bacterium]
MSMALDLGSSRFRTLRREGRRLVGRQTRTAYLAVADSPAHVRLLNQAHVTSVRADDAHLVLGTDAEHLAVALGQPLLPLLPEGRLPEADPLARQLTAELLHGLIGARGDQSPRTASLILPGDATPGSPLHDFVVHLLNLQGLAPKIITSNEAICLAELGSEQFTGIVLRMGASDAGLALVEHGNAQTIVDVPCGGDWIDRRLAEELEQTLYDHRGECFLDLIGVRSWKHIPERSLSAPSTDADEVLVQAYREILAALLGRFRSAVVRDGTNGARRRPLSLVCQGGPTIVPGFAELLMHLWRQADIDLPVAGLRVCRDPLWTAARGCLIHAEVARPVSEGRHVA